MNKQVHEVAEPKIREALTALVCLPGPIRTRANKLQEARQIFEEKVLPALNTAVTHGDKLSGLQSEAAEITEELTSIVRKLLGQPALMGSLVGNLKRSRDVLESYEEVLEDTRRATDDTVSVVNGLVFGLEFTHMTLHEQAVRLTEQEVPMTNAYHLLMDFEA